MWMALRSLDHDGDKGQPARLYFAGPDELATAIGYDMATAESRHAGLNKVAEDIALLVKVGAIERIERGRSGHRAVYRLRVDAIPSTTATVVQKDHRHGGDSTTATVVSSPPPQWSLGEVGTTKENDQEPPSSSPRSESHQGPAESDDDAELAAALSTLAPLPTARYLALKRQARSTLGRAALERDVVIAAARAANQ
ncbi:MAG: hypothetical protein BGO37_08525 [Cellulomonas sp. 73-92]|nr:MAG: hypothetical protein BGO37_08525 [Cellulomonas sp. 73-92]